MNVKIANVNRKSKSLNYIDSKMLKMLEKYNLSESVSGGYEFVSNPMDHLVVRKVKQEIDRKIKVLTPKKGQSAYNRILLKYYQEINYILIKEGRKKIQVFEIKHGGIGLGVSHLVDVYKEPTISLNLKERI